MESLILSLFNETRISEYLDNERAVKKHTKKKKGCEKAHKKRRSTGYTGSA